MLNLTFNTTGTRSTILITRIMFLEKKLSFFHSFPEKIGRLKLDTLSNYMMAAHEYIPEGIKLLAELLIAQESR